MKIRQNPASLNSLRHASNHFDKVKGGIERLSSGVKINKGADGPATLIASERLRGHIVGLKQVFDNASSTVALFQTAEGALNEVSDLLIKIKQLTIHAQNEAINNSKMLVADQQEIENLLDTIDRISKNTEFGGKRLLDGSMGTSGTAVGDSLQFVSAEATAIPSPEKGWEVDIHHVATRAHIVGSVPIDMDNVRNGLQIVLNEGGRNLDFNVDENQLGKDIKEMVENADRYPLRFPKSEISSQIRSLVVYALNQKIIESGLDLQAIITPGNKLLIRHNKFGDSTSFAAGSSVAGILSDKADIAQSAVPGKNIEGTINKEVALGEGQYLSTLTGMKAGGVKIKYDKEIGFREIPFLDQDGIQAGTKYVEVKNEDLVGSRENPKIEGYVHVSQKSKEFQVGLDKNSNPSFSLANVSIRLLGNGINNKSEFRSLADIDVTSLQGAKDASVIVDKVIEQISILRGEIGSFQKNALESNLNSLKVAEQNITQAESTIRDSDMAAEMSDLTKDKILFQASTAMIAQANQVPETVLGLIQNK